MSHIYPVHPVKPEFAAKALINESEYFEMYQQSIEDNEAFWGLTPRIPLKMGIGF